MKIRYRWYCGPEEPLPMHGCYLMSERGRGAYLILAVNNRGKRGGLGEPVYELLVLTVERATREAALADPGRLYSIKWDSRAPKRWHLNTRGRALEPSPAGGS